MPRRRHPLILITACMEREGKEFRDPSLSLSDTYPLAIAAAGGLPSVVANLPDEGLLGEMVRRSDGVMLTGGDDLDPRMDRPKLPEAMARMIGTTTPVRDSMEVLLIREVFRQRKPLLAICRGHQLLNVALGGANLTDLRTERPGALDHCRMDLKDDIVHKVALTPDSILHKMAAADSLGVNSSHHQAVGRLAPSLSAAALSSDGVVEAMELAGDDRDWLPYCLAVQFHPERLFDRHPVFLELFRSFTRACCRKQRSAI